MSSLFVWIDGIWYVYTIYMIELSVWIPKLWSLGVWKGIYDHMCKCVEFSAITAEVRRPKLASWILGVIGSHLVWWDSDIPALSYADERNSIWLILDTRDTCIEVIRFSYLFILDFWTRRNFDQTVQVRLRTFGVTLRLDVCASNAPRIIQIRWELTSHG